MKPSFSGGAGRGPVVFLNRLPYLLKRTLTLTPAADTSAELAPPTLASIYSRPKSPSAQTILLSILPPIRSSALVWTYTRLLCTSAAYIAGMSLYDFIATTLSLNTKGIRIYDVLSQHPPPKSRYKLIEIWIITVALIALVIFFVKYVVQISERSFAQQIRMQMHKIQHIQNNISKEKRVLKKRTHDENTQAKARDEERPQAEDGGQEERKHEASNNQRLHERPLSIITEHSASRPSSAQDHSGMSLKALKAIRDLEERRAIARAVLSSNDSFRYDDDEDEEAEDVTQAVIANAVAKGIPLHEILAKKHNELSSVLSQQDPTEQIDTTSILLYRLIDLVAFYLIFVAVYALSNTIQLSFDNSEILYSFFYFIILIFLSIFVINWLLVHQHALSEKLQKIQGHPIHNTTTTTNNNINSDNSDSDNDDDDDDDDDDEQDISQPQTLQGLSSNKRVKRFKVTIGVWKKMSGYIVSSLAYLLAYAVWAFLQAILTAIVDKHVRSSAIYLWAIAALTTSAGAFFLVLLSVRIRSQVYIAGTIHATNKFTDYLYAALNIFCCADYWYPALKMGATPWSTARLHMTVDVVSGQVTSEYHQLMSESLSYILALAFGAALTASFSVVPADAGEYIVQPSRHAIIWYAVVISFVLAVATLQLERWIRHLEDEQRQKTAKIINKRGNSPAEHEPVVKIIHSPQVHSSSAASSAQTNGNGISNVTDIDSPQNTRYQCDSEYSSLYILHKQHDYERLLRGRETPDEVEQRKTRKLGHRTGLSPLPPLSSPSNTLSPPPLRTAQSLPPPPLSPLLYSPPDVISPTMSPEPTPLAHQQPTTTTTESTPLLLSPTTQKPLSKQEEAHRQLLSETFLHEYRVALAATLTQGFALLVAYAWVGVFQFVLLPILMEWNILDGVSDVVIKGIWSIITFVVYFLLILGTLRILHKQEALEL